MLQHSAGVLTHGVDFAAVTDDGGILHLRFQIYVAEFRTGIYVKFGKSRI